MKADREIRLLNIAIATLLMLIPWAFVLLLSSAGGL